MSTIVMKFGGASVATPASFSHIAEIILSRRKIYDSIAIVVSAMGDTTDKLIALAKEVHSDPPRREYDMLLTVGERISIALLAMALAGKNADAISFTGSQSGIITTPTHSDARIIDVKPHRLFNSFNQGKIVIVAGFQGVSQHGDITTLGRGGSDTTAVALGVALGATKVEFFKDVLGICNEDPKKNPQTSVINQMTYDQALNIVNQGAKVLHSRCVELASKNGLPLHVLSFNQYDALSNTGTLISDPNRKRCQPIYE